MGCLRGLFKIVAALVGLTLTLGGVGGFCFGIYMILKGNIGGAIMLIVGSVLALTFGTMLGNFARGDYD
jgi:hypothetical protein